MYHHLMWIDDLLWIDVVIPIIKLEWSILDLLVIWWLSLIPLLIEIMFLSLLIQILINNLVFNIFIFNSIPNNTPIQIIFHILQLHFHPLLISFEFINITFDVLLDYHELLIIPILHHLLLFLMFPLFQLVLHVLVH